MFKLEENTIQDMQQIEDLNKALSTNYEYATTLPGNMTGGAIHQYESLDKTLRTVTYDMKNLKFWPEAPKDQAYNTVESFDVQNSYGNEGSGFFNMGDAPVQKDAGYSRHVGKVKYIGTQRQINDDLTLIRPAHGPVIAREIKNGTMYILGQHERYAFEASEAVNPLEYDGIGAQIISGSTDTKFEAQAFEGYNVEASTVVDLRGDTLDEDNMEIIALNVLNNFGFPTNMHLDTKAHSDFSRSYFPKQRIAAPGTSVTGGIVVPDFSSSAGVFKLESSVFRRPRRGYLTAANNSSAPATPVISVAPAAAGTGSKFTTADAGTYYYVISAFNEYGESAGVASASVTVAAGQSVSLTVANQASTYGFYVFRTRKGEAATSAEFIKRVAKGTTTTVITDDNSDLPGLSTAYLLQQNADSMQFKMLAPLLKKDLAVTGTNSRFLILSYGMPLVYMRRQNVLVKNIGRAS